MSSVAVPRPAERRGQAAAEWIAVIVAISVLLGGTIWLGAPQVRRVSQALDHAGPRRTLSDQDLLAAIAGRPDALSPLGAVAWLDEEEPASGQPRIAAAVAHAMRVQHAGWGRDLHVSGPPIRGLRTTRVVHATGPVEARVVTFADEREGTRDPTLADRAGAAGTNLAWQGMGTLARRIARPLGLAVGALQLAVGLIHGDDALPAGVRAGDIIVCRSATITAHGGVRPSASPHPGWRVGVLRQGRLILDAVALQNPCRTPAGA